MATVTHYHKIGSLKQCRFLSNGLKSRCQGYVPSGGWSEKSMFSHLPASRSCPHSLAHGPLPLSSKPAVPRFSCLLSVVTALSDHSCESLSTFKNLCDQIVPMWLSQDNLPISKPLTLITPGNSLLLYKLTYLHIMPLYFNTNSL